MRYARVLMGLVFLWGLITPAQAQQPPPSTTKTLTSNTCPGTGCLIVGTAGSGGIGVQITGTFSATVPFTGSVDGTTYVAVNCTPYNSTTAVTSASSAGSWGCAVGGLKYFKVGGSGWVSGSVVVTTLTAPTLARGSGGGGGSGTIGGTIADGQVAVGTGTDEIGGSNTLTWELPALTLTADDLGAPLTGMWTVGSGWTDNLDGTFTHTPGNTAALTRAITVTVGRQYRIATTLATTTAGEVTFEVGSEGNNYDADGPVLKLVIASTTDGLVVTPSSDFDGTVTFDDTEDNSVEEIPVMPSVAFAVPWAVGATTASLSAGVDDSQQINVQVNGSLSVLLNTGTPHAGTVESVVGYNSEVALTLYNEAMEEAGQGGYALDAFSYGPQSVAAGGLYGAAIRAFVRDGDITDIWGISTTVAQTGSGHVTNAYAQWTDDMGSLDADNPYYLWFDSRAVLRYKEDVSHDSVGQAVLGFYNPLFEKYTPGAANFERYTEYWDGDVINIGPEAGGTGSVQPMRLLGSDLRVVALTTTGAASGKTVVCVDTSTGQLYASSTGTDCSN